MTSDALAKISQRLRKQRRALDVTLKEMAGKTGISYTTLSAYEHRFPRRPKDGVIEKISRYYRVPLEELRVGDGGLVVEEPGSVDYSHVQDQGKKVELEHQHSDKKALRDITNLFSEGTGLLSIGDLVSRIRKYGGEEEENELLDAQLEFQDRATRIWRSIRMKQGQEKKVL